VLLIVVGLFVGGFAVANSDKAVEARERAEFHLAVSERAAQQGDLATANTRLEYAKFDFDDARQKSIGTEILAGASLATIGAGLTVLWWQIHRAKRLRKRRTAE
jgi:hypothetical protein